jgi:tetratricopeptide (TPR) repeat protein
MNASTEIKDGILARMAGNWQYMLCATALLSLLLLPGVFPEKKDIRAFYKAEFERAALPYGAQNYEHAASTLAEHARRYPQSPYFNESCYLQADSLYRLALRDDAGAATRLRLAGALLWSSCVRSPIPQGFDMKNVDALRLKVAERMKAVGAFNDAILEFDRLVPMYPAKTELLLDAAECYSLLPKPNMEKSLAYANKYMQIAQTREQRMRGTLALARIYLSLNELDKAAEAGEAALAEFKDLPELAPLCLTLARAYSKSGKFDEAIRRLQTAAQVASDPALRGEIDFRLGEALTGQRRFSEALGAFGRVAALADFPLLAFAGAIRRADCYVELRETSRALAGYTEALSKASDAVISSNPYIDLADTTKSMAKLPDPGVTSAKGEFETVLSIGSRLLLVFPNEDAYYLLSAAACERLMGWAAAEARAAGMASDLPRRERFLGILRDYKLQAGKLYAGATRSGVKTTNILSSLLNAGRCFLDAGYYSAAVQDLLRFSQICPTDHPNQTEVRYMTGLALRAMRRFDEAIREFDYNIQAYPNEPFYSVPSRLEKALTMEAQGRTRDAIACLNDAIFSENFPGGPDSPTWRKAKFLMGTLYHGLAVASLRSGNAEDSKKLFAVAAGHLDEALQRYPNDAELCLGGSYYMARCRMALLDNPGALDAISKTLSLASYKNAQGLPIVIFEENADIVRKAYFIKGDLLCKIDDIDGAVETYRAARDKYLMTKESLDALLQLVRLYQIKGNYAEATRALENSKYVLEKLQDRAFENSPDGFKKPDYLKMIQELDKRLAELPQSVR